MVSYFKSLSMSSGLSMGVMNVKVYCRAQGDKQVV